jgi:protein-S-isoprenylcysteine O-methyltransferase Ste14
MIRDNHEMRTAKDREVTTISEPKRDELQKAGLNSIMRHFIYATYY